jgi:hypothetical protein
VPKDFYSGNQVLLHRAIAAAIGLLVSGEFARMDAGSF